MTRERGEDKKSYKLKFVFNCNTSPLYLRNSGLEFLKGQHTNQCVLQRVLQGVQHTNELDY